MSEKKPRGFQKGHKLSKGKPPLTPEVRGIRAMSSQLILSLMARFFDMDRSQLATYLQNPATPSLDLMLGKFILKAIDENDPSRFKELMDRLIGKSKESIALDVKMEPKVYRRFNSNEELVFVTESIEEE